MRKKSILGAIKKGVKILIPWVIGMASLWLLIEKYNGYVQDKFGLPGSPGTFGDSYGALGVVISGFALIGVIITMIKQQSQIDEQMQFIARTEMNETFFKLLAHLKEVKLDVGWTQSNGQKLESICLELKSRFEELPEHNSVSIFNGFYDEDPIDFNSYFRTLRYLLNYLYEHPLDDEEKRVYSNLLRAQISQEEAALIYYNMEARSARTNPPDQKFEKYICKFNLLADLKTQTQVYSDHVEKIDLFIEQCGEKKKQRWWSIP